MVKAQQVKLARQEKLIGDLRAELGKSRSTLEKTRREVKRGNREARTLAARVEATPGKDGDSRGKAFASKDLASKTFALVPQRSSFSIDASYLYFKPYLTDTYFASTGTAAHSMAITRITIWPSASARLIRTVLPAARPNRSIASIR